MERVNEIFELFERKPVKEEEKEKNESPQNSLSDIQSSSVLKEIIRAFFQLKKIEFLTDNENYEQIGKYLAELAKHVDNILRQIDNLVVKKLLGRLKAELRMAYEEWSEDPEAAGEYISFQISSWWRDLENIVDELL